MNSTFRHQSYKVELKPTSEQKQIIERTMGVCRYVYNLFIGTNRDNYRSNTQSYMSGYDFSKWLNNEYRKANPDKSWIWEVSSKAVKKSIMNADIAYRNFLKGKSGFPNFKRRNAKPVSMYLSRNNAGDLKSRSGSAIRKYRDWYRSKELCSDFGRQELSEYQQVRTSKEINTEAEAWTAEIRTQDT